MKQLILALFCFLMPFSVFAQGVVCVDCQTIAFELREEKAHILKQLMDLDILNESDLELIQVYRHLEQESENLLDKYYKILYDVLNDEGKVTLVQHQRNWTKFKETETDFRTLIYVNDLDEKSDEYVIISTLARVSSNIDRLIDFYEYLLIFGDDTMVVSP